MFRYVRRDLVRNPRRTIASLIGVILGVGLFSGVLFFIDGSGASMTQRALAPLALDMQVVLDTAAWRGVRLTEQVVGPAALRAGQTAKVVLRVRNPGAAPANEVVVLDRPPAGLDYVAGTATAAGKPLHDVGGQIPFSQGLAGIGLNIGTVRAGTTVVLPTGFARSGRSRTPARLPCRARSPPARAWHRRPPTRSAALSLPQLVSRLARIPGVASVDGLQFVDLPPGALSVGGRTVERTVRLFGFDGAYARRYPSIHRVTGDFKPGAAVISAEAAEGRPGRRDGGAPAAGPRPAAIAAGQRHGRSLAGEAAVLQP